MNQRFIELAFGFGHSPVAVGYRRVIENCGGPLPPLGKGPKGGASFARANFAVYEQPRS